MRITNDMDIQTLTPAPLQVENKNAEPKVAFVREGKMIVAPALPHTQLHEIQSSISKQIFDRTVAALGLLALLPVFLLIGSMIKKDGGPAFYYQDRVGYEGKPFKCWKFRSMIVNADQALQQILANDPQARAEWDKDFKLKNDPRITKTGHFIRRTSLDELPQLWNVLRGDMSLVGPRPVTEKETLFYGDTLKDYISVKPGMTGLWQISGRNNVSYAERVALDSRYVHTRSFFGDLGIIMKTVKVMCFKTGAY